MNNRLSRDQSPHSARSHDSVESERALFSAATSMIYDPIPQLPEDLITDERILEMEPITNDEQDEWVNSYNPTRPGHWQHANDTFWNDEYGM